MYDVEHIKSVIASILESKALGRRIPVATLHDDFDLRDEGLVDSLGFVELLAELEQRLHCTIDLSEFDPEHLTNVAALARHIARTAGTSDPA